ncbi:MAG: alpha/beta hydrolase family protein [Thermonemataceae bacterium]
MFYEEFTLHNADGRPFSCDIRYPQGNEILPVIIFVHGFKGFKDWGHFNLLANTFAKSDLCFVKINLSMNGTTPTHPTDFVDLEAFGRQTYAQDLADIGTLIDHLHQEDTPYRAQLNLDKLYLLGHSRGGCVCLLKAVAEPRVKAVATWASVSTADFAWNEARIKEVEEKGVTYIANARTQQQMPLYASVHEEGETIDLAAQVAKLDVPALFIHGMQDTSQPYNNAEQLFGWGKDTNLFLIPDTGHTFDGKHPYEASYLPEATLQAIRQSVYFFKGTVV